MPGREIVLATDEIYHVINRGVTSQPTYADKRNYQRFLELMFYYQNLAQPGKYSHFYCLSSDIKEQILSDLRRKGEFLVDIICYCLMPNHFHLLLKQNVDNGISNFLSLLTNSYTRYFNTKNERHGPLFQGKFKAIRIENNEQLLHVSRYIHLNPYSGYVLKTLNQLESYPFSSLPEYLYKNLNSRCQKALILDQFKNRQSHRQFVFDQADYQRQLQDIKQLLLE